MTTVLVFVVGILISLLVIQPVVVIATIISVIPLNDINVKIGVTNQLGLLQLVQLHGVAGSVATVQPLPALLDGVHLPLLLIVHVDDGLTTDCSTTKFGSFTKIFDFKKIFVDACQNYF